MTPLVQPRSFHQVRVGKQQVVDVVINVRRCDDDIDFSDVLELLQDSILPRLFGQEVEDHHFETTRSRVPPPLGVGGIPLGGQKAKQHSSKRKANNGKRKKPTKKEIAERQRQEKEADRNERRSQKDVYYATSETIRIAYQLSDPKGGTATLVRGDGEEWKALTKLKKRIVCWCYPIDVELPTDQGFLRPDTIPLSSLFRPPKEKDGS